MTNNQYGICLVFARLHRQSRLPKAIPPVRFPQLRHNSLASTVEKDSLRQVQGMVRDSEGRNGTRRWRRSSGTGYGLVGFGTSWTPSQPSPSKAVAVWRLLERRRTRGNDSGCLNKKGWEERAGESRGRAQWRYWRRGETIGVVVRAGDFLLGPEEMAATMEEIQAGEWRDRDRPVRLSFG